MALPKFDKIRKVTFYVIFFNALGKGSNDPLNPDWVSSILPHSKASPLAKLRSTAKQKHHHKLLKEKREKASLEAQKKPLKYAIESPLPNEDVDMIIDEITPLLPHQEIEESEIYTSKYQVITLN